MRKVGSSFYSWLYVDHTLGSKSALSTLQELFLLASCSVVRDAGSPSVFSSRFLVHRKNVLMLCDEASATKYRKLASRNFILCLHSRYPYLLILQPSPALNKNSSFIRIARLLVAEAVLKEPKHSL
mmetsp:Transcript_23307/g.48442  ORF Transcript_23307/g.48442 Transcript_23307/m.48442 type:complete len:126 (-) Transcript_23307:502-879(-)